MKKTVKKLTLAKETVRTLDQELTAVQGGLPATTGQGGTTGTGVIADSRRIC